MQRSRMIVVLLAVATITVAWTEIPMKAEDAKIHVSGFEAEG